VLNELAIRNFALIDDLTVTLAPGLSVLTGETGAGKSIIIDALGAALGERVAGEMVRSGADVASVDAVFEAAGCETALQALREADLLVEGETTVILSRQVGPGRSPCRVNGRPVSLAVLQEVSRGLVDIHGQHEHQELINEDQHLDFLDSFGDTGHQGLLVEYQQAYAAWAEARQALERLRQAARDRTQRLDLLRFQAKEIADAALQPDEEDELFAERRRLGSVEKLRELTAGAWELLAGGDDATGATAALQQCRERLAKLAEIDESLAASAAEMQSAATIAAELEHELHHYLAGLESDPKRLEAIEARLELIAQLKRKYGAALPDVIAHGERAAQELADLQDFEDRQEQLQRALQRLGEAAGAVGVRLRKSREKLSATLCQAVEKLLQTLGMPAARFGVELCLEPLADGLPGPEGQLFKASGRGFEQARFVFCANTGEELRPLAKVASGGELSRIMLALKSLSTQLSAVPTMIFDEVDAGIGGQTAHKVGERLAQLARQTQVLCVTHLPQIAGLADHHLHVEKVVRDGRTVIAVRELTQAERVAELARMFGADEDDATARKHAESVLAQASHKARERQPRLL
jgi:DNA repair protein RecN (Recombination protein N)